MGIDGRDELRRQRQHQARAKARAARAQRDAVDAGAVLQHHASRESV